MSVHLVSTISGSTTRFVDTGDIQRAVAGRETEVLHRLRITPPASGHIRCPYPDHGGENDWRWDHKKAKAYCTCGVGSIFDVTMKCEGLEFGDAKVRVAEMISRVDLIKERDAGRKTVKTDPQSLLSPNVDQRDDALPAKYLAFRLGVEPELVVLPNTAAVGWKALPYYDAPAADKKDAKPTLIGDFPCTVWETLDRDGGRHAQRIYVAPRGQGKASLGLTADGRERDVKKSARKKEDENVAGRAVLWGDAVAPWTILCEGIETGAAIALAFREEIGQGELMIAAAITAGGIEAFRPWPSMSRITVAADRDELVESIIRTPSRRGERAAITFAARNTWIEIAIALPGVEETKTDWLDVLESDGIDAVRAGILDARSRDAFTPVKATTPAKNEHAQLLVDVSRLYPLPHLENTILHYGMTPTKRVRVYKEMVGKEGDVVSYPIASPFGVPARLRFIDSADDYGLRVVVEAMNGVERNIDIPRDLLASGRGAEVLSQLYKAGLRVESDGERVVLASLKAADPHAEIAIVRRAGWHNIKGCPHPIFVCPDGDVIGAPVDMPLELTANCRLTSTTARGGSLEGWKAAVATATSVQNCEHWALGAISGFVGVLVDLVGLDTCGINLSGRTSAGKTLAQRLAASVWSIPSTGMDGLFQTAKSTINGIESSAARATGTVLVLDELGHVSGQELGKLIYTLAGNVGKTRLTGDATRRPSYQWRTFALLSAEKSLAEIIRHDGAEMSPGMALRIVDIDVTEVDRKAPAEIVEQIESIIGNYGFAGSEFVRSFVAAGHHMNVAELRKLILAVAGDFAGEGADSATRRAAQPFALLNVAGELAQEYGLLPADLDIWYMIDWAWGRFLGSAEAETLDSSKFAVQKLRDWILERWASKIQDVRIITNSRDAEGWFDSNYVYIPHQRLSEAAGGVLKEREVAAVLDKLGYIAKRKDKDCRFVNYIAGLKAKTKAYALPRGEFGRSPADSPSVPI